jgi:hypothetical protein
VRLRLLTRHVVNDQLYEPGTVLGDVPGDEPIPKGYVATPQMEGLDAAGVRAVADAILGVYGRHPGYPYNRGQGRPLLDNPPIIRPLDDNQPVPPIPASR